MNIKSLLGAGVLGLFSAAAFAGLTASFPVQITLNPDGSGIALGDMLAARTSANGVELIGCGYRSFKTGLDYGWCQAIDANDNYVACFAWKANLHQTIKGIAPNSYIRFEFDEKGECTRIDYSTQSWFLPSNLTGN